MRGVSLLSRDGPVVSARNSWVPPIFSIGRMATARITMPMPPRNWSTWRYSSTDLGSASSVSITVAPVVVSAEVASNTAPLKLRCGGPAISGRLDTTLATSQVRVTIRKPSRRRRS